MLGVSEQTHQPPEDARLLQFKKDVNWDNIESSKQNHKVMSTPTGMIGILPDITKCPFIDQEWLCLPEDPSVVGNSVLNEYRLKKNNSLIRVKLYVFSKFQHAKNQFINIVSLSGSQKIPYKKTRQNIGALSVATNTIDKYSECDRELVLGLNYYIEIVRYKSDFDIHLLAEWLNAYAESKVVPDITPYLPVPQRITVTPSSPRVGQAFEIRVEMKEPDQGSRYWYLLNYDPEQFVPISRKGGVQIFKPKNTGRIVLPYTLLDTQISLFHKGEIEIDVAP